MHSKLKFFYTVDSSYFSSFETPIVLLGSIVLWFDLERYFCFLNISRVITSSMIKIKTIATVIGTHLKVRETLSLQQWM